MGAALGLAARVRAAAEEIDGIHVNDVGDFCGPDLAAEFDPLPVVIDITQLGTTGYAAADWLRGRHHVDMHLFDHRRISTQVTQADDAKISDRLLTASPPCATSPHTRRSCTVPHPPKSRLRPNCDSPRRTSPGTPTSTSTPTSPSPRRPAGWRRK